MRRDVLGGRVWSASPTRVIHDDGDHLVLGCWPGVRLLAPTTWIEWLQTGDPAVRKRGDPEPGRRSLGARRLDLAGHHADHRVAGRVCFSVHRYLDVNGRCDTWSVSFELPYRRNGTGNDIFDLPLDLVVAADLSRFTWKDEDECAQARRLGLIDDRLHAEVESAREQVVGLVRSGRGPFVEDWTWWRPDPAWTHRRRRSRN